MTTIDMIRSLRASTETLGLWVATTASLVMPLAAHAQGGSSVACWGYNNYGQCTVPAGLNSVASIAAGNFHTVAAKSDGSVACWGDNAYGQSTVPAGLNSVVEIAAGGFHTVALKNNGLIVCWGWNGYSQCTVPTGLNSVVSIAAGSGHTVALKGNGSVVCWGSNIYGQSAVPAGLNSVTSIAAGWLHTVALKSDGSVACWGDNAYGQSTVPLGLNSVASIAAGYLHTVALKSDGSVACWGHNAYGQCTVPEGLGIVTSIAAGSGHTIALKIDGSVACWGGNAFGQSTIPDGLASVTSIAAGGSHAVARLCATAVVARNSGNLGAIGYGVSREFTFAALPAAASAATLSISVRGDLDATSEYLTLKLDGVAQSDLLFVNGASDCPTTPNSATRTILITQLQSLIVDGSLTVRLEASSDVSATLCSVGFCEISLNYFAASSDCDSNGVPDSCDIAGGAADCNGNFVPDSCDIAGGAADCNDNGIPDSCELAGGAPDCNGNTIPDSCDIASGTSADIDSNGVPDTCQTVTVPGNYATIQSAIDGATAGTMRIINVAAGTYAGPVNFSGKSIIIRGAGAATTKIQGTGGANVAVVQMTGESAISALERVTVTGGLTGSPLAHLPSAFCGGGLLSYNSAASVRDCVFDNNQASFGGGAYFFNHTGSIERCTFSNNDAAVSGGGFQTYGGRSQIVDALVFGNYCNSGRGGGVHMVDGTPVLLRVSVTNNLCSSVVGGLSWVKEWDPNSFATLTSCTINDNDAAVGQGGLGIYTPTFPVASISLSSTTVCGNLPRPNIDTVNGEWNDLGGNNICDCDSDINHDSITNGLDLSVILSSWGTCTANCDGDLNHDGIVSGLDLAIVLSGWGACTE